MGTETDIRVKTAKCMFFHCITMEVLRTVIVMVCIGCQLLSNVVGPIISCVGVELLMFLHLLLSILHSSFCFAMREFIKLDQCQKR